MDKQCNTCKRYVRDYVTFRGDTNCRDCRRRLAATRIRRDEALKELVKIKLVDAKRAKPTALTEWINEK